MESQFFNFTPPLLSILSLFLLFYFNFFFLSPHFSFLLPFSSLVTHTTPPPSSIHTTLGRDTHHPRPRPPPHPNTRNQDPQKHPSKPPTPRPRPSPSSRCHHPQPPQARADRHKHLKIGNLTTPRPRPSTQDKTEPPRDPRCSSSTASLTPYSPPPRDPGRDHHREPDAVNTRPDRPTGWV